MEALRLEGIRVDYPGRGAVLDGVHLAVRTEEVVIVTGRSGSGKSTLLALAAGLDEPTSGTVHVMGERLDKRTAADVRARHLGLVFQNLHLLGELNVEENIALPLRLRGVARKPASARTSELLDAFGLGELARRRPASLSGGEQQRVAIARALAPRPGVLLVDEPTSSLDAHNARTVRLALMDAARLGAAVLVATHDEILYDAGRRLHLHEGRLHAAPAGATYGRRPPVQVAPPEVPRDAVAGAAAGPASPFDPTRTRKGAP